MRIVGEKILFDDDRRAAAWVEGALIGDAGVAASVASAIRGVEHGSVLACWSGTPAATAEDLFPDDPGSWTPAAWAALDAALDKVAPRLAAGDVTLLIRPHHRHVVGDVPSVGRLLRGLREREIERVGVLLDAESMLADSMRTRDPENHLRRIREALRPVARFEIV